MKEQIAIEHLQGNGLELGALNNPLAVDPQKARVMYADRLAKPDALRLFPELEAIAESIVEPDLLLDLDQSDLREIGQQEFDFVIANHVIEHVVNPIQFLKNISNHLKPGGLFFLTVPDKDHTFDRDRQLTSNEHLWREYQQKVTKLANAHIKDFLLHKEPVTEIHPAIEAYFKEHGLPLSYYQGNTLPINPFKRRRLYEFHRNRSIHVHVWNKAAFDSFLHYSIERAELEFSIVPTHNPDEVVGEMIYLLKRDGAVKSLGSE